MNIKEIKELLDLMQEHHIASLEFEKGDVKLKLCKNIAPALASDPRTRYDVPVRFAFLDQ